MTDKLRILALITARGGSKRIPGKNLRLLGGTPLILWSIDVATEISDICDILVSTDHAGIAETSRAAGALVPWLRPPELATDVASSVDVCLHALNWYEEARGTVDGLLLLQPTSPFRTRQTVRRGIDLFCSHECRSVVGVSPAVSHPMWCLKVDGNSIRPFIDGDGIGHRSQDLPPAYVLNGALYLVAPAELQRTRSFCNDATLPLIMDDPAESLDIDTEWDWKVAEALVVRDRIESRSK